MVPNFYLHSPEPVQRHQLSLKSLIAATVVAISLAACGTAKPVGQTSNPNWKAPAADFRLGAATVVWKENPTLSYITKYAVYRSATDKSPPKATSDRAQGYMNGLLQVFRTNVVKRLASELSERKVSNGNAYSIVITPVSGNFDDLGWGSGLVVRTDVVDLSAHTLWSVTIETRSGLHWIGGASAPAPDEMFVNNFVESLLKAMTSSGMLPT